MSGKLKNIEKGTILKLKEQIVYQQGQIVSKTLVQNEAVSLTLFAFEKERVMNRSTVMRILDAMELWTEGNLFNFHVIQCGSEGKKMFYLERA